MLGPILDGKNEKAKKITETLNGVAYKMSEDDFDRKFSVSLAFWLDAFPLMPKTILRIREPKEKKETMVMAILVGTTFVELRCALLGSQFYRLELPFVYKLVIYLFICYI